MMLRVWSFEEGLNREKILSTECCDQVVADFTIERRHLPACLLLLEYRNRFTCLLPHTTGSYNTNHQLEQKDVEDGVLFLQ